MEFKIYSSSMSSINEKYSNCKKDASNISNLNIDQKISKLKDEKINLQKIAACNDFYIVGNYLDTVPGKFVGLVERILRPGYFEISDRLSSVDQEIVQLHTMKVRLESRNTFLTSIKEALRNTN